MAEKPKISDKQRIAELEAKVYTYEQIIAKSNFSPFVIDKPPIGFNCNGSDDSAQ